MVTMKKNIIFVILTSAIFFSGCGGKNTKPNEPIISEDPHAFENITAHYYLQPGDVISITFFQNQELDETVPVRPDGRISLQLIDEVEVAGLTPPQVQELLNKKYTPYLKKPMATVTIKSFGGQKVYVGGQVNTPGVITIGGRTTVAQAIFDAGGVRSDANISDVLIISRGTDSRAFPREVNLKKALKGKLPEEEILIRPYDIIYVPKSGIVKANEFMSHVYSFIPPNVWFGFSYEAHRDD
jgi:protein involved in polysaccharide export with SLBB domain